MYFVEASQKGLYFKCYGRAKIDRRYTLFEGELGGEYAVLLCGAAMRCCYAVLLCGAAMQYWRL